MVELYYCNPHELIGKFATVREAADKMQLSDYCTYATLNGVVVASTARDNPQFKVGYVWR